MADPVVVTVRPVQGDRHVAECEACGRVPLATMGAARRRLTPRQRQALKRTPRVEPNSTKRRTRALDAAAKHGAAHHRDTGYQVQ